MMKMGHLYIIRHGQTDWNVEHMLQGRTDIPLNENGRNMAKEAALKYKDIAVDICYTSPLKRAYETACILFEGRDTKIVKDDRLIEMCFGEHEGTKGVFHQPEHPMYKLFKAPSDYVPDAGSESFEELYKRTGEFIKEILIPQLKEGKNILVSGHGAMNLSIINQLLDIPIERFWERMQQNCEMMEIDVERKTIGDC